MRPHGVIMFAPTRDLDLGFDARERSFHVQTFVAELAVEAFAYAILPRFAVRPEIALHGDFSSASPMNAMSIF